MEYRGIIHERLGEASFVGALILAKDCPYNCKGCFNQHLKSSEIYNNSAEEIIAFVKNNIFNQGIILGGLEWTWQPKDMIDLVNEGLKNNLKVMIFTHMYKDEFLSKFPTLKSKGIIVKFGAYEEGKTVNDYYSKGTKLATSNQYIEEI